MTESTLNEIDVNRVLTTAVREKTGNSKAKSRPGQNLLAGDITKAINTNSQVAGIAGTGVGKSFALLSPAFADAMKRNRRTIISTQSLTLQAQVIDSDAPTIQKGLKKSGEERVPSVAILKGWSNYVCRATAERTLKALIDGLPSREDRDDAPTRKIMERLMANDFTGNELSGSTFVDKAEYANRDLVPLLYWALSEGEKKDKDSYEGLSEESGIWSTVSVGTDDCLKKDCRFWDKNCKPQLARKKAAAADVVVTNHTMLAIQAAKNTPVVLGNDQLGDFDNIMVDEAHALPGTVRSQGTVKLSARQFGKLASALADLANESLRWNKRRPTADGVENGLRLGNQLLGISDHFSSAEAEVEANLQDVLRPGWPKFDQSKQAPLVRQKALKHERNPERKEDPLNSVREAAKPFFIAASAILGARGGKSFLMVDETPDQKMQRLKVSSRLNRLQSALALFSDEGEGASNVARWVDRAGSDDKTYGEANSAPIDVAAKINENLWTREDRDESVPMSVTAVSATLPPGFAQEAGLDAVESVNRYDTPFTDAYRRTAVYMPTLSRAEADSIFPIEKSQSQKPHKPKRQFDGGEHQAWALGQIRSLVEANDGSALILTTNAENGKFFRDELRNEDPALRVISQWDDKSRPQAIEEWKRQQPSVLIGTRSFMTGLDAPGPGNTLVIVDRIARARPNPVDDARVQAIMKRDKTTKTRATDLVYVADAAILLGQSAGRLIRSIDDYGMVALLDPRMRTIQSSPPAASFYKGGTLEIYRNEVAHFGEELATLSAAVAYIHQMHVTQTSPVAA